MLDDTPVREAMEAGGFRTKREAIEAGLRLLARQKHHQYIISLQRKLRWEGELGTWSTRRLATSVYSSPNVS